MALPPDEELEIKDFGEKETPPHLGVQDRETTRRTIAFHMLWLIALLSVGLVAAAMADRLTLDEAKDLAGTIIAPLLAIFGTVVGFFFGSSSSR